MKDFLTSHVFPVLWTHFREPYQPCCHSSCCHFGPHSSYAHSTIFHRTNVGRYWRLRFTEGNLFTSFTEVMQLWITGKGVSISSQKLWKHYTFTMKLSEISKEWRCLRQFTNEEYSQIIEIFLNFKLSRRSIEWIFGVGLNISRFMEKSGPKLLLNCLVFLLLKCNLQIAIYPSEYAGYVSKA